MKKSVRNILFVLLSVSCATAIAQNDSQFNTDVLDLDFQLILAADEGDSSLVVRLINAGADVNAVTYYGVTPLMYASQNGYPGIIEVLLDQGADPELRPANGHTALISAVRGGQYASAETLIRQGADIDFPDYEGVTPLMHATLVDDYVMTDMLLYYGVDISNIDQDGMNALMTASAGERSDIPGMLIEAGIDVNVQDSLGRTALHFAVAAAQVETIELLLRAGAITSLHTHAGYTPLALATALNHYESARKLVAYGAAVDTPTEGLTKPLELAMRNSNHKLAMLLRNNGAEMNLLPSFTRLYAAGEFSFGTITDVNFRVGLHDPKYNLWASAGYGFWLSQVRVLEGTDDGYWYQFWEKRSMWSLTLDKTLYTLNTDRRLQLEVFAGFSEIFSYGRHSGSESRADREWTFSPRLGVAGEYGFLRLGLHYQHVNLDLYKIGSNRINLSLYIILNREQKRYQSEFKGWI